MGLRAAQVGHALLAYALAGYDVPDNLVVLQVADEDALVKLLALIQWGKVEYVEFCEPDLAGELTAIAVGPNGQRLLSNLPLLR